MGRDGCLLLHTLQWWSLTLSLLSWLWRLISTLQWIYKFTQANNEKWTCYTYLPMIIKRLKLQILRPWIFIENFWLNNLQIKCPHATPKFVDWITSVTVKNKHWWRLPHYHVKDVQCFYIFDGDPSKTNSSFKAMKTLQLLGIDW